MRRVSASVAASDRAEQILRDHRDKLDLLATTLEQEEVLDERQITELIGPPTQKRGAPAECSSAETPSLVNQVTERQ